MINCKNKEYVAFLLDEHLENLVISGFDYLTEEAVKKVQEMIARENSEIEKTLKIEEKK
jgi:hypothetical protein